MLNENDLEFIRQNREDIVKLRTVPIMIFRSVVGTEVDPLTGEYKSTETSEVVDATWSNITSGGAGSDDITMVGGVVAQAGDAIADFDISVNMTGVEFIQYKGAQWRVRSRDDIGLGVPNRWYVLLRKVT